MSLTVLRSATARRMRLFARAASTSSRAASTSATTAHGNAKFGKAVAADDSAAQNMTDIGRGRYEYIGDFMASMQRGPVKLEFGDRAPTEKERAQARRACQPPI